MVVTVTQDVEDPFGIDGFCQDFGGHLSELLRRTVEALLVAQLVLAGLHRVLLRGLAPVAGAHRPRGDDRGNHRTDQSAGGHSRPELVVVRACVHSWLTV